MTERWAKLVEKYGSEEAARAEMKRRADLSSRNKAGKGGFAALPTEQVKEISKLGVQAREANKIENKSSTTGEDPAPNQETNS